MANKITNETIEHIEILTKLKLSKEEKEQAKEDMTKMLAFIEKLNEVNTNDTEPMSHVFPISNCFREDVVTNTDDKENMILNAPVYKKGMYQVPKTI